jgi:hypothetical protein
MATTMINKHAKTMYKKGEVIFIWRKHNVPDLGECLMSVEHAGQANVVLVEIDYDILLCEASRDIQPKEVLAFYVGEFVNDKKKKP